MTVTQALISFALVAGLVTITPGLDTAMVLRSALRGGRRAGLLTTLGVNAGVLCWGLAAALGISALLAASTTAYDMLRYAGAAYLVWLGSRMLLAAARPRGRAHRLGPLDPSEPGVGVTVAPPTPWACFRAGLVTNLLNPKVGAFYVALLPQFLPEGIHPAAMGALLELVHNVEGLLFLGLVTLTADAFRRRLTRPSVARRIDVTTGAVLVGFGVKLALTPR